MSVAFSKKVLVAFGVMISGYAPLIYAQSNLVLYGTLDVGMAYSQHSASDSGRFMPESSIGLISGGQSGNRFGLKGKEELGVGQSIKFQLENGFNIGNGKYGQSGRMFGRQSWIGYENQAFGQIQMGRQNNIASDYAGPLSPFTGQYSGASFGMSFGTANAERLDNLVKFETAELSGFKFGLGYSFAAGMTSGFAKDGAIISLDRNTKDYNFATNNNLRTLTMGGKYSDGPLYATLTYDSFYPDAAQANNDYKNANAWIFGVVYDFTQLKLSAAYGQTRKGAVNTLQNILGIVRNDTFDNTNSSIIFDDAFSVDSYMITASFPVTQFGQFFAAWQMAVPSQTMQAVYVYPISTQKVVSAGCTYNLSKQTSLYSYFGYATNAALISGLTSSVVGFGLTHKF